jgi:hypothetical protein
VRIADESNSLKIISITQKIKSGFFDETNPQSVGYLFAVRSFHITFMVEGEKLLARALCPQA